MGFRLVLKSVTLNDLERFNDRRRALFLRQLSFFIVTSIFAVFISVAIYTQSATSVYSTTVVITVK